METDEAESPTEQTDSGEKSQTDITLVSASTEDAVVFM